MKPNYPAFTALLLIAFILGYTLAAAHPMPSAESVPTAYACRKANMVTRGQTNVFGQVVRVYCYDKGYSPSKTALGSKG